MLRSPPTIPLRTNDEMGGNAARVSYMQSLDFDLEYTFYLVSNSRKKQMYKIYCRLFQNLFEKSSNTSNNYFLQNKFLL